jgi:hypothetical protein
MTYLKQYWYLTLGWAAWVFFGIAGLWLFG